MESGILSLYEDLILCRPTDAILFSVKFFECEKSSNSQLAHAFHRLPFLLTKVDAFRDAAGVIFCNELLNKGVFRDTVDGRAVYAVLERLVSERFQLLSPIEDFVKDYILPLEDVSFKAFLVAIRVPLECYAVSLWFQDVCSEFNGGTANAAVDVSDMLAFIKRSKECEDARYNTGSSYNHYSQEDVKLWSSLLAGVFDRLLNTVSDKEIGYEMIADELVKDFISTTLSKIKT